MKVANAVSAALHPGGKLRVAMLVERFPVLSETFVINQIVGLLQRGHHVDIYSFAAPPKPGAVMHPDVLVHGLIERTCYATARPSDFGKFARAAWDDLAAVALAKPRALFHVLNVFSYPRNAALLRLLSVARRLGTGREYDVVHCQFGTVGRAALALYDGGLIDGALVVSFRGADISRFVQRHGERVYDRVFRRADYVFTNCAHFERRLHQLGCDSSRLQVLYSGIDCARFPFRPRSRSGTRPVRLITVGRLVEKKGIEYALHAIAQLVANGHAVEYNVIGEGPLRPKLEALVATLGLTHLVSLPGAMNQRDIVRLLDRADVFLGPSVRAADGDEDAPINVIKEALAMGLPVVATRHGGIPELVQDGVSGYLVPERNAAALAQRLAHLIEHADEWPRLAAAGRDYIESHFNLHRLNDRLVDIYQLAISNRRHQQRIPLPCQTRLPLSPS